MKCFVEFCVGGVDFIFSQICSQYALTQSIQTKIVLSYNLDSCCYCKILLLGPFVETMLSLSAPYNSLQ